MILHGIVLSATSFIAGILATWFFFCLKMDRDESKNWERLEELEEENGCLKAIGKFDSQRIDDLKQCNEGLTRQLERLYELEEPDLFLKSTEYLLKKQKEKEKCH